MAVQRECIFCGEAFEEPDSAARYPNGFCSPFCEWKLAKQIYEYYIETEEIPETA